MTGIPSSGVRTGNDDIVRQAVEVSYPCALILSEHQECLRVTIACQFARIVTLKRDGEKIQKILDLSKKHRKAAHNLRAHRPGT